MNGTLAHMLQISVTNFCKNLILYDYLHANRFDLIKISTLSIYCTIYLSDRYKGYVPSCVYRASENSMKKEEKKNMVAAVFWSSFSCVSHTKYSWYRTAYLGHCSVLGSGNTVKPQEGPATHPRICKYVLLILFPIPRIRLSSLHS